MDDPATLRVVYEITVTAVDTNYFETLQRYLMSIWDSDYDKQALTKKQNKTKRRTE